MRRFPLIESLRAFGTVSVVSCHVLLAFNAEGSFLHRFAGWLGPLAVALFFVISGFVLYRPFIGARTRGTNFDLLRYAKRRIARVVPAYWICLTVFAAFGAVSAVFSDRFWIFYGFMQIYFTGADEQGLAPAWTLCVEVVFYALLPLFALAMRRHGAGTGGRGVWTELLVLTGLALLFLSVRDQVVAQNPDLTAFTSVSMFSWFAIGMTIAVVETSARESAPGRLLAGLGRRPMLCLLVALCAHALVLQWPLDEWGLPSLLVEPIAQYALSLLGIGVLLLPVVFGRRERRLVLGNPFVLWLGQLSYGIYLWHDPLVKHLYASSKVSGSPYPVLTFLVLLTTLTLALAAASYYLVERPILRRVGSRAAAAQEPQPLRADVALSAP